MTEQQKRRVGRPATGRKKKELTSH